MGGCSSQEVELRAPLACEGSSEVHRGCGAPATATCGDAVEVRNRLCTNVVFSGNRQLVIYLRAKVLSVSVGTESYLVEYPAINSKPSRVARVPSWDVREPRHALPQAHPAADAARPTSSKRPPPPERTDRGDDCCKKAKRVGKGIPMDALCRFYEEHDDDEGRWRTPTSLRLVTILSGIS